MVKHPDFSQMTLQTKQGVPLMETPEKDVQNAVVELLRKAGYMVIRLNSGGFHNGKRFVRFYHIFGAESPSEGASDLLAFKGSEALLLEAKTRRGKLSEAQEQFRDYAAQHGVSVFTVRSVEDVLPLIENVRNRPP